ncbi:hypothetical protein K0H59_17395 [Shewanella sp. FJAT-51649]|uniref:hypothetical protein n=1 Tax=Shewanella sp. FJAT-51649 TaxID=2864210 RepID=UPI001C658CBC|nr:hypothetical protein [Shewanella sp. FJAT-51649]QYJ70777.1 hypothetical protein K0H59_17395 [Shewanella sp. FJAT-51649]
MCLAFKPTESVLKSRIEVSMPPTEAKMKGVRGFSLASLPNEWSTASGKALRLRVHSVE